MEREDEWKDYCGMFERAARQTVFPNTTISISSIDRSQGMERLHTRLPFLNLRNFLLDRDSTWVIMSHGIHISSF